MKALQFLGSALDDLRAFPEAPKRDVGYQLDKVQHGQDPSDWRPMPTVGKGAYEIRVRDETGAFRVIYVAKFAESIYVLHCFQKKTQKTGKADINIAAKRYGELLRERDQ